MIFGNDIHARNVLSGNQDSGTDFEVFNDACRPDIVKDQKALAVLIEK